ncbi:alcohol dehydrogenase [Sulfolobus acidocaldarius SUSAZ]|nr:alcohol dehydrogenase [Sulfolobus acidocaldarius SUSAZ]
MRAAILEEYKKPLRISEITSPSINGSSEVLLQVTATGLCHGDIHIAMGEWDSQIQINLPIILGHEVVGKVIQSNHDKIKKNDLVLVYNAFGCKNCKYCKFKEYQFCEKVKVIGVNLDGGFAEYVKIPDGGNLIRVNTSDPIKLAPLADAGLTAYNSVKDLEENSKVLIIGTGAVALIALQLLKLKNVDVTVIGENQLKLDRAEKLGADEVISIKREEESYLSLLPGKKFDYILDYVGSMRTLAESPWLLNKKGELRIIGEFGGVLRVEEQLLVLRGLRIRGILYGSLQDLEHILDIYLKGKIDTLTTVYKLEDINDAITDVTEGKVIGRAVIVP